MASTASAMTALVNSSDATGLSSRLVRYRYPSSAIDCPRAFWRGSFAFRSRRSTGFWLLVAKVMASTSSASSFSSSYMRTNTSAAPISGPISSAAC